MSAEPSINYVRLMREIRDRVSREIAGMTYEEEERWMEDQLAAKNKAPMIPTRPSAHGYEKNVVHRGSAEEPRNDG